MTTPLISLAAAKATLNIDDTDGVDDGEIYDVLLAASEVIASECVELTPTEYTEEVRPTQADRYGTLSLALRYSPVLSVTSVTPVEIRGGVALDLTGIDINATVGVVYLPPTVSSYFPGGRLRVVYTAGMASLPESVKTACRAMVQWLWESQRGSESSSVLGAGEEGGPPVEGMPPHVAMLLRPYQVAPTIA